jgi:hypothetical protein
MWMMDEMGKILKVDGTVYVFIQKYRVACRSFEFGNLDLPNMTVLKRDLFADVIGVIV